MKEERRKATIRTACSWYLNCFCRGEREKEKKSFACVDPKEKNV
jgi:hypothetical protein